MYNVTPVYILTKGWPVSAAYENRCPAISAPQDTKTAFRHVSTRGSVQLRCDSGLKMKAAQFFGKADIRVVDVPEPEAKDNEVLVDIEWCGICGSDLHEYICGQCSSFSREVVSTDTVKVP